jgi:nucleoside-diphosphate-sugar epimerase
MKVDRSIEEVSPMNVFVTGATGAIGKRLIPQLIAQGHEVIATTRSPDKTAHLRHLGAQPVIVDPLDEDAVVRAVSDAAPHVIINELTALSRFKDLKHFDDEFEETNRLRTEGLDHLLTAARIVGTSRVLVQGFTGWPNIREGGPIKTEDDPLDPAPPKTMARSLAALRYLEQTVTGASDFEGLVLRYGTLYGPGTSLGVGGTYPDLIRTRRFPIIGSGAGVWSFVHVDDAAAATVRAVERGAAGVYNIVDDEPAPVSEWLPTLAWVLGAKPPRRLPVWLGRLAVGDAGVAMMTSIRGSSNTKAKQELGWQPRFASWREGFQHGLGDETDVTEQVRHLQAA